MIIYCETYDDFIFEFDNLISDGYTWWLGDTDYINFHDQPNGLCLFIDKNKKKLSWSSHTYAEENHSKAFFHARRKAKLKKLKKLENES